MISPSITFMKRIHFPSCHLTAIQRKYCCTWHVRDGKSLSFVRLYPSSDVGAFNVTAKYTIAQ